MTDFPLYDDEHIRLLKLAGMHDDRQIHKEGLCRCEPPRMKGWPVVSETDWCGKHDYRRLEGEASVDTANDGFRHCISCRFFSQHKVEKPDPDVTWYRDTPDGSESALVDHPDVDRDAKD